MPKDAKSFNNIFVVINYFNKQSIFTSYFKTITAKDIAYIFINKVYYYYRLL